MSLTIVDRGILAFNMATFGTAADFLEAYRNVKYRRKAYHVEDNPLGFIRAKWVDDPIGSEDLKVMGGLVEDCGFEVVKGEAKIEFREYSHASGYAQSARIFARDKFLAPYSRQTHLEQEQTWEDIVQEFIRVAEANGWNPQGPYKYPTYNMYIIAQKRSRRASVVPEPHYKKPVLRYAKDALDLKNLELAYGTRFLQRGEGVRGNIVLQGRPEEIQDLKVAINLHDILSAVFTYAYNAQIPEEKTPVWNIDYTISDKQRLIVGIEVRTLDELVAKEGKKQKMITGAIEEIFRFGRLNDLKEAGVLMSFRALEQGVKRYEFQIHIIYE